MFQPIDSIARAMPWPAHDDQAGMGVVFANRNRLFAGLTKDPVIEASVGGRSATSQQLAGIPPT
jgi:hypothetical protein